MAGRNEGRSREKLLANGDKCTGGPCSARPGAGPGSTGVCPVLARHLGDVTGCSDSRHPSCDSELPCLRGTAACFLLQPCGLRAGSPQEAPPVAATSVWPGAHPTLCSRPPASPVLV